MENNKDDVTLQSPIGAPPLTLAVQGARRIVVVADDMTRLTIVAAVPVQALPTLYSRIGDVFAYVCIIAFIAVTALGFARWQA